MSYESEISEAIVATIDNYCPEGEEKLIIHSHINTKGKMVLNRTEAALLLVELYKFLGICENKH